MNNASKRCYCCLFEQAHIKYLFVWVSRPSLFGFTVAVVLGTMSVPMC